MQIMGRWEGLLVQSSASSHFYFCCLPVVDDLWRPERASFLFCNSLNRAAMLYFMLALNIPARRTLVTAYSRADLSRALSARLTTQRRGARLTRQDADA